MKLLPPTDREVENHHGNQASLSSLPSPSSPGFTEGATGLVGSSCSQGHRIENDRETGVADGTFVRERGREEMTNCGTTTFEGQGPSVWLVWPQPPVESPNVAVIHLGSLFNTEPQAPP